jgi:putative lipoic acid-binding regulatory protein
MHDESGPESGNGQSTGAEEAPPKIEFPCLYPIKVIGRAVSDFREKVLAAIERHTGALDPKLIQARPSKQKNYVSITVTIAATGEEQLQNIFIDLKEIESVKLVL